MRYGLRNGCGRDIGGERMSEIIKLDNVIRTTSNNWSMINGISLCIRENERVMISGRSDSGKDTLMRLIAGMDKPSSGSVVVLNEAVHAMNSEAAAGFRNRNIGVVQPEPGFMERLNIAENISLPLIVRGIRRDQRKKAAEEMLRMLEIWHVAPAYPAHLSIYEARVASLARALITKPLILMLNEVTFRLSEREAKKIIGTINAISQNGDYTIIYFGDDINNRLHTNRTILIENGMVRED